MTAPTAETSNASIFRLVDVSKHFGGTAAVDHVDFDLRPGEVHALVGENGAGKSTLMRLAVGLQQPDAGRLEVDGRATEFSSTRDAEAAGIAIIPQELDLFAELSVAENLFVGRSRPRSRWGGLDRQAMEGEARRQLDRLGIPLDVTLAVRHLSAANRQIVAIARALVADARAVVMDEPTAALSEREAERLFKVIRDLTTHDVGVVYISHRLEEVFAVADRITVLRDGRHVATQPAGELNPEELVRLMVGRELSQLYQRSVRKPGDVALEVRGLSDGQRFHDVDLAVRFGEVVGLAGLIGAGRSELAQTIFGLRRVTAGEISLEGTRVSIDSPESALAQGIAYLPEERKSQGLIADFTITRNMSLSVLGRLTRMGLVDRRRERDLAQQYAQMLSVRGARLDDPVDQLSGGNQQKVVVSKSLASEPAVLLLDEPTRGIDIGAKSEIYELIDGLARDGKAVLMISSELEEILALADRIVVMREGRIAGELAGDDADQERVMALATGTDSAVTGPSHGDNPDGVTPDGVTPYGGPSAPMGGKG